jgi:uncharacterized protein
MHSILLDLNGKSLNIQASAIISQDGLVIASTLPANMDEDHFGGITAALFSVGFRRSQEFAGGVDEMIVKGSRGYLLMTDAGKEAYLTVLTKTNAELDQIFSEVKRAAKKITECLLW